MHPRHVIALFAFFLSKTFMMIPAADAPLVLDAPGVIDEHLALTVPEPSQRLTNVSKTSFEDAPSKKEQLPEHASTPSTPAYTGGRDDAVADTKKIEKGVCRLSFSDSIFEITGRLRVESLYGQNLRFLNDENNEEDPELDRIGYPGRHTLDMWFLYIYGQKSRGYDVVKFRLGLRNRGIWGSEINNLSTNSTFVKTGDAFVGDHSHAITRNIFWARELWFEAVLNDVFGWQTPLKHTFTMGLFPFSLGRGIALGDAFATDPDFLGYFSANAIDQFAPGFKLSGELIGKKVLAYDLYADIVDNSSATFNEVNESINAQRFGRRFKPQRGFGVFDYILAARLMWRPIDIPGKRVYLEAYGMFSHDGEQKIEFIGDAKANFFTFGLAGEFEYGNFECGFDTAFNLGRQDVFGWDRNAIRVENRDGHLVSFFSEVFTEKPKIGEKRPPRALVTDEIRELVNSGPQGQQFNGKRIRATGSESEGKKEKTEPVLFNGLDRFTNPYHNDLRGAMFVCDFAYKLPYTIKVAGTAGISTGGENPNKDLQSIGESNTHRTFRGFIGEQEIYSGKRVRSIYVMSGEGRLPRVFSIPAFDLIDGVPARTERFTNLILAGTGLQIKPKLGSVVYSIQTNMLAFWVDKRPRVFEATRLGEEKFGPPVHVRKVLDSFLGVELNFILEAEVIKDLTFIMNSALFLPGGFFKDLKGVPLEREELAALRKLARPNQGAKVKKFPRIGNDPGFFINFAFEYRF